MNGYIRWNDALASRFFNPEMAGRNVYLFVNPKLVSDMEKSLQKEAGPFLSAVKGGPPWAPRHGICQCAYQAFKDWRSRGLDFPPYIGYLGLFVLAGGTEGNFDANAYHPRLRQLAEIEGQGFVPSFDLMRELWEDLETWSVHDKKGELGIFHARRIGGHINIGYPLAQSVLAEQERKALPQIFFDASLDPTSTPPADELARVLRTAGAKLLLPRTLRVLTEQYDKDFYRAVLDTAADELASWDGEVQSPISAGGRATQSFASLRLCLGLDSTARKARALVRCKLNRDFPEEAILLNVSVLSEQLTAEDYLNGWSSPLCRSTTGEALDASRLNWTYGTSMTAATLGWHLKLPPRAARMFVNGKPDGLPDLVEVAALPRGQPFFLAYSETLWPRMEKWATDQCRGFQDLGITSGLPAGWRVARIAEATSDDLIRGEFPFISFPPSTKLRLVGGIRSGRGNNFFFFAPPKIVLEGGPSNLSVTCNKQPLSSSGEGNAYDLPANLPVETRILIEATSNNSLVASQSLFLTGDFSVGSAEHQVSLDRFGFPSTVAGNPEGSIVGVVHGNSAEPLSTETLFEDIGLAIGGDAAFLIGQVPGQILSWPADSLPNGWRPTWAVITKRRRSKVVFLGEGLGHVSPDFTTRSDERKVRKWKEIVWYRRKRVSAPVVPALRVLWKELQEVARNV